MAKTLEKIEFPRDKGLVIRGGGKHDGKTGEEFVD